MKPTFFISAIFAILIDTTSALCPSLSLQGNVLMSEGCHKHFAGSEKETCKLTCLDGSFVLNTPSGSALREMDLVCSSGSWSHRGKNVLSQGQNVHCRKNEFHKKYLKRFQDHFNTQNIQWKNTCNYSFDPSVLVDALCDINSGQVCVVRCLTGYFSNIPNVSAVALACWKRYRNIYFSLYGKSSISQLETPLKCEKSYPSIKTANILTTVKPSITTPNILTTVERSITTPNILITVKPSIITTPIRTRNLKRLCPPIEIKFLDARSVDCDTRIGMIDGTICTMRCPERWLGDLPLEEKISCFKGAWVYFNGDEISHTGKLQCRDAKNIKRLEDKCVFLKERKELKITECSYHQSGKVVCLYECSPGYYISRGSRIVYRGRYKFGFLTCEKRNLDVPFCLKIGTLDINWLKECPQLNSSLAPGVEVEERCVSKQNYQRLCSVSCKNKKFTSLGNSRVDFICDHGNWIRYKVKPIANRLTDYLEFLQCEDRIPCGQPPKSETYNLDKCYFDRNKMKTCVFRCFGNKYAFPPFYSSFNYRIGVVLCRNGFWQKPQCVEFAEGMLKSHYYFHAINKASE